MSYYINCNDGQMYYTASSPPNSSRLSASSKLCSILYTGFVILCKIVSFSIFYKYATNPDSLTPEDVMNYQILSS